MIKRGASKPGTNDGSFAPSSTGGSAVAAGRGYGDVLDEMSEERKRTEPVRVGNQTWPRSTYEAAGEYRTALQESSVRARRALEKTDSAVEADGILDVRASDEDAAFDRFATRTGLEYPEDVLDQTCAADSVPAAKVETSQGRYSDQARKSTPGMKGQPLAVPSTVLTNGHAMPFGAFNAREQVAYFQGQTAGRDSNTTGVPMASPDRTRASHDLHTAGASAAMAQAKAAQADNQYTYVVGSQRVENVTQIDDAGTACRGRTIPTNGGEPQDIVFDPRMVTRMDVRRPGYQT